ncbi:MAG: hypothetical protein ACOC0J_00020 [Myxococcota bacterium]
MNIRQNFSKHIYLIGAVVLAAGVLAFIGAPRLVWICVAIAGVVPVLIPDRRTIFVLITVFVLLPLLFPMRLPTDVTPAVRNLYEAIEDLERGSVLLMSFDFDPATKVELYPAAKAFMRQAVQEGHTIITMALWPLGVSLAEEATREVIIDEWNAENPDDAYEYGRDYVHLPYMPGGVVVVNQLASSFEEVYPNDLRGTPLDDIPALRGVTNLGNVDFAFALSSGDPGLREWIMVASDRVGIPVGGAATAVSAPEFYPYLQSGQLTGLLGGLKGAAEYETLLGVPDSAVAGMDAQSLAHLAIIIFIIVGNVMFFTSRRRGQA